MVGLGEDFDEMVDTFRVLREHRVQILTVGQYLRPTEKHLPVVRYWEPDEFDRLRDAAYELGFESVASGPLVRSSYHADEAAAAVERALGRRVALLERERVRGRPVRVQMLQPRPSPPRCRARGPRHPPQAHVGRGDPGHPLAPAAHHLQVAAGVDEVPERLDRLPDGHVDDQPVVVEGADRGGVAGLVLQPPDEAGRGVGEGVDRLEVGDELGQRRESRAARAAARCSPARSRAPAATAASLDQPSPAVGRALVFGR